MKESNMPRADFVVSILLLVFGIAVTWHSLAMPRFEDQGGAFLDSPGIVPAGIGILIAVCSFAVLVRSIVRKGYRLGITATTVSAFFRDVHTQRMFATIGLCVFYGLFLLRWLHFIASTLVFVFVFVMVFEYDVKRTLAAQWKVPVLAAVVSGATTAAVYFSFSKLFLVNLP